MNDFQFIVSHSGFGSSRIYLKPRTFFEGNGEVTLKPTSIDKGQRGFMLILLQS